MNRIALGTVQFGLDYGINNPRGKVPEEQVAAILERASAEGIDTLDTSSGYGESEQVLGRVLGNKAGDFNIISKYPRSPGRTVSSVFKGSLQNLGVQRLQGYLLHHFDVIKENPGIWNEFLELKSAGLVDRIGFSFYHTGELKYVLDRNLDFDLVQVPFNVLDRRFLPYFPELKKMGVEIHVRSVFLQGLLLKPLADIPSFFNPVIEKLSLFRSIAEDNGLAPSALALDFALNFDAIDRVVIGVDSLDNLTENLHNLTLLGNVKKIMTDLYPLNENNVDMLLPTNWKIKG